MPNMWRALICGSNLRDFLASAPVRWALQLRCLSQMPARQSSSMHTRMETSTHLETSSPTAAPTLACGEMQIAAHGNTLGSYESTPPDFVLPGGRMKRPRGAAPRGKRWDKHLGWVPSRKRTAVAAARNGHRRTPSSTAADLLEAEARIEPLYLAPGGGAGCEMHEIEMRAIEVLCSLAKPHQHFHYACMYSCQV